MAGRVRHRSDHGARVDHRAVERALRRGVSDLSSMVSCGTAISISAQSVTASAKTLASPRPYVRSSVAHASAISRPGAGKLALGQDQGLLAGESRCVPRRRRWRRSAAEPTVALVPQMHRHRRAVTRAHHHVDEGSLRGRAGPASRRSCCRTAPFGAWLRPTLLGPHEQHRVCRPRLRSRRCCGRGTGRSGVSTQAISPSSALTFRPRKMLASPTKLATKAAGRRRVDLVARADLLDDVRRSSRRCGPTSSAPRPGRG